MADNIEPISHTEKVIAGQEQPISHLEKIIAYYGTGGSGGSGVGTGDYNALTNKPLINGVELSGDKTLAELGVEKYDDSQVKQMINNLIYSKQEKTDVTLKTEDKTLVGSINKIYDGLLDNVTFSSDYKNIILNRKGGNNPYIIPIASIVHNAKITELNDIDSTNIGDGKTLIYDGATKKHKYVGAKLTDELVKMDNTTDGKYLSELIDKNTVINDNGVLKVKKLDGQEVTITEINYLKGLTMNIVDLVKSFSNGGVKMYEHTIPTYADLLALDRSSFVDGIRYFVYVLADETHGGIKTTYICDKENTDYFGVAGDDRDFTAEPIDLANEVTGKLGATNIDTDALWKLLTISNAYRTHTNKNEVFGTHGANYMYNELVEGLGEKANTTDLTTHTNDTDIHITSAERDKWNNKIDKTSITTNIDSNSTDEQLVGAKTVYEKTKNMCTTTVADVGPTNIIFSSKTNYDVINNNCRYFIENGICTVFLYVKCKTPANSWTSVSKVPKASFLNMCSTISSLNGDGFLRCSINTSGGLNFANGTAGTSYLGTITYKVAE